MVVRFEGIRKPGSPLPGFSPCFSGKNITPIPIAQAQSMFDEAVRKIAAAETPEQKVDISVQAIDSFGQINADWYDGIEPNLSRSEEVMLAEDMPHEVKAPLHELTYRHIWPFQGVSGPKKPLAPHFEKICQQLFKAVVDGYARFQSLLDSGMGNADYKTNKIFGMAFASVAGTAKAKKVKLSINGAQQLERVKPDLPDYALYTLFSNLLQNAVKYTPSQGEVKVSFSLEAQGERNFLNFEVEDTGIGIPANEIDTVLDGKRAVNAIKSGIPGTGYGLRRVYRILENADSTLTVQSPVTNANDAHPGTRILAKIPLKMPGSPSLQDVFF